VPGGTYNRSNDPNYPATVSDFRLDRYEVTVGRFRKFVEAYSQNMVVHGAGRNPHNTEDPGWQGIWSTLPADAYALRTRLSCGGPYQTWTDAPGANEHLPMTCLDAELANAFCTWDGGRVPTEAEWKFAAAGGDEQRQYPWGAEEPGENSARAIFGDEDIAPVGSISAGQGRWGHMDLAGNVPEWTRDRYSSYPMPCHDCSNFDPLGDPVFRGGGVYGGAEFLQSSQRALGYQVTPATGVRCARPVLPDTCNALPAGCSPNAACCGPPPTRGAFTLTLEAPSPPPAGKSCPLPGATLEVPVVQTPAEKLTASSYQHAVVQGEAGAVVQCAVVQESPLVLSALIRTNRGLLELDDVTFWPDNTATARAFATGFDQIGQLGGSCQLGQLQIEAGESPSAPKKIHGSLDCAALEEAPSTYCPAKGAFVFENCAPL
jgi:formylglycine-generating enzyme required for sulfatase activity